MDVHSRFPTCGDGDPCPSARTIEVGGLCKARVGPYAAASGMRRSGLTRETGQVDRNCCNSRNRTRTAVAYLHRTALQMRARPRRCVLVMRGSTTHALSVLSVSTMSLCTKRLHNFDVTPTSRCLCARIAGQGAGGDGWRGGSFSGGGEQANNSNQLVPCLGPESSPPLGLGHSVPCAAVPLPHNRVVADGPDWRHVVRAEPGRQFVRDRNESEVCRVAQSRFQSPLLDPILGPIKALHR